MQHRVGPPLLQPLADFIKVLGKEVIDPRGVDRPAFDAAPVLALAAVMTAFLYVPGLRPLPPRLPGGPGPRPLPPHPPDGGPLPRGMALPERLLGRRGRPGGDPALHLRGPVLPRPPRPRNRGRVLVHLRITALQGKHPWFAILQPIGFIVALVGLQAKLERTPFDIPEAETEIVAGPWTDSREGGSPS